MNKTARREYFRKIESLYNITKAFKFFMSTFSELF
jgi:hypothetical protein